jgi:CDP-diacylglycerol--serine O-phosphatidyltransferase
MRRHGRRAYVRSVYFLPSLATLGNAVCGFGAMYVAAMAAAAVESGGITFLRDPWTQWWARHGFIASCYLIFAAMAFDALDGRLARFTRHTTDFGGQLDSLADVVSFGAAPAFIALQVFKSFGPEVPVVVSRLIWAIGALYFSCAALRLARFNVSNEHGEQHHFSFLGLPSPGAGGTVVAFILMQQDLRSNGLRDLSSLCIWLLPIIVLGTGLLMVSGIRYPHVVNRYLRGKRSLDRLLAVLVLLLLLIVWHQYTLALGMLVYALLGPVNWAYLKLRPRPAMPAP